MRLVYSFNCSEHMEKLLKLCRVSKDLYNQALYASIQAMKQDEPKFLNYYDLNEILQNTYNLEGTINYRLLKAQVAQQTLKLVATALKSYFKAIKDYKQHPDKYTGSRRCPTICPEIVISCLHIQTRVVPSRRAISCYPRTLKYEYPNTIKCEMVGIRFIENEESYTSKCDALALEPVCKHESYLGKRIHRGLFQSSTGRTLNADVNGALNILRKVVGDSCVSKIADSGWLFQPRKLSNLHCLSSGIVFNNFNGN